MPNIPVNDCCGCTACFNACPTSAISMQCDSEGFSFPMVNAELCVNCNKCERVCPIISPPALSQEYSGCFVAQSRDDGVLDESTSGGFIDAVYKYALKERNGYAVGVAYDNELLPRHMITDSYELLNEFRNSKYAQSTLDDTFKKIKKLLNDGKYTVFVGTPCQVAGLKAFLQEDCEHLLTVDLVCRSIPSPLLWKKYLDWQEKCYKSKIQKVSCRKKTFGYHSGTLRIAFENKKCYNGSNRVDYYMKAFHKDICSRNSCYNCHFKTRHRCSDLTVFDCWEPQAVALSAINDNDRGFSNVVVHTTKGAEILKSLKDINLIPADPERIFDFAGGMESNSIEYKNERKSFYKDIEHLGFEKGIKKYIKVSFKDRVIESLKPIRYSIKGHRAK